MQLPDLADRPALWLGLRCAEKLRESLNLTLNGRPLPQQLSTRMWLATQHIETDDDSPDEPLIHTALAHGFMEGVGIHPEVLVRGSNAPSEKIFKLGESRSSAGWQNPANFVITSAFVRLLGACEQFELDVLKGLLHHRPSGLLGPASEWIEEILDVAVITEEPERDKKDDKKLIYHLPPMWTWLRKPAENNVERAKILSNVFGISVIPDGYSGKQKQAWYDKRNAIAHGRSSVDMTLREYIDADVFVAKAMTHVSNQCREKLKLIV